MFEGERPFAAARSLFVALVVSAVCAGLALAPAPTSAGRAYLTGVDVSHWQGEIGWAEAHADGVGFVIAKATEGRFLTDDQYARNRSHADALGLPFTAYHFARPDNTAGDARLEADHFVRTADLRGRHLVPVLDLEVDGGLSRKKLIRWTRTWLQRVEALLGVKPMIYTSAAFWRDSMNNTTKFATNGYDALWISHWHVDSPRVPAADWAGAGWTFWQTTDCGQVAGIDGCVDVDRYGGTDINSMRIRNRR